ncbi:MAG: autotransporter outer membrane beta-barrel domain-containing protein, partial [Caulobacteraceae bacterium]
LVTADPAKGTNTRFMTGGMSSFATGSQVGLTLLSVQSAPTQTYTILQTVGAGTLTAPATFGTGALPNAPYLYTANATFVPGPGGGGAIDLTVARKTAAQLNFNAAEGSALDAILAAVPNDANIQKVILAQTTEAGLKSAYDQLLPDQGQGLFDSLDAAAQAISSLTGTTPDAGTRQGGQSLWLQEVNERVDRRGVNTLGSTSKLFGLVGGYERMGVAGGAVGVSVAYLNAQEQDTPAAVGEHVVGSMVEGGLYYRRATGPLTVSARGAVGYSWFSGDRRFLAPGAINIANSNWGGLFYDAHAGVAYERGFGRFYARPELSVDYLRLNEGARDETGGGTGFDLNVASRVSSRLSGQAIMVLGRQWGRAQWLRTEVRAGYREIFSGSVGDTVASFAGGTPFTLVADPDTGGWATVGFSLKSGTQFSYVALEGDADFRDGEQRYDLRVAGRSIF